MYFPLHSRFIWQSAVLARPLTYFTRTFDGNGLVGGKRTLLLIVEFKAKFADQDNENIYRGKNKMFPDG